MRLSVTMTNEEVRDACADWVNAYGGIDVSVGKDDVEITVLEIPGGGQTIQAVASIEKKP